MNTISLRKIREFAKLHPDSQSSLSACYKIVKKSKWRSLVDVRQVYPQADIVGRYTVFNVRGNHYRLIAEINYEFQQILIRQILTHEEYDRGKWKS
jgi:mRNA interferase HigB